MAVKIAGREVKKGDLLYHSRAQVWGQVVGFDPTGPAILKIKIGLHQDRELFVQNGGKVNGIRVMYWHEPISLDLPTNDVTKLQHLVDVLAFELYGVEKNVE